MTQDLLLLELVCPSCGAALTAGEEMRLTGRVRETGEAGEVRLSARFGEYRVATDLSIAEGGIVEFTCPSCERSLMVDGACTLCGGPNASVNLATGGSVEFCARRGCRGHALGGFGDLDEMIDLLNRMFKIPHD